MMSEDAAIVERVPSVEGIQSTEQTPNGERVPNEEQAPDVELGALVSRVTPHVELDPPSFEQAAIMSDAARQVGDDAGALVGARALLAGLVRDLAYELRRSPNESVTMFRARSRPLSSVRRHSRFLVHKRFLMNESEAQNVQRAATMTNAPEPDSGANLAAWSRLARQMVYTAADRLLTRYAAWKAGCACEAGGPAELVLFQPLGGGSAHERVICQRCHCPRQTAPLTETPTPPNTAPAVAATSAATSVPTAAGTPRAAAVEMPAGAAEPVWSVSTGWPTLQVYGGADTPALPMELLHAPFQLVMTLLHRVREAGRREDGFGPALPLPQAVADLLNELRQFEWTALPPAVEQALRDMDKRRLMMVCVRSVALLHGLVAPQRALHRLRRQEKRRRWVARQRAHGGGCGQFGSGHEPDAAVVPTA